MSLSLFSPPVSISSLLGMADEQFKPRPATIWRIFFTLFLLFSAFFFFFNADFSFLNSSGENVVENFRQIAKFSLLKSFPSKSFVKTPNLTRFLEFKVESGNSVKSARLTYGPNSISQNRLKLTSCNYTSLHV